MNKEIDRLSVIADQSEKWIVGLMAGTSLDGLDIALCKINSADYETELEVRKFRTVEYIDQLREKLVSIAFSDGVNQRDVSDLHRDLGVWYGQCVNESLRLWGWENRRVDLVASHGQTTYHVPSEESNKPSTLQLGDGDQIACMTGIPVISDFRQKFIAAGGEGAPITPFADRLLFSSQDEQRILLNIGGIANYTWLGLSGSEETNIPFAFSDTGPGNTLINEAVRFYYPELTYDKDGKIAAEGEVNVPLLDRLMAHPFLQKNPPKSTGPEAFRLEWVQRQMEEIHDALDPPDIIATLTQYTVDTIIQSLKVMGKKNNKPVHLYVSGGGIHNKSLMKRLQERLPGMAVSSFAELGIDPNAREAASFAVLANQTVSGEGIEIGQNKYGDYIRPGKISLI